jgi:DNA-binding transcriptional MerR regulator
VKKDDEKLMRIKKLSEETGVPRGTIKFYIREGLIPRPIKTQLNMAYYNDKHLDAIRLVKELQSKRFLPLSIIKQIVGVRKDDMTIEELRTIFQMDGKLFLHLKERPKIKPVSAKKLCEWTGVPLKEIKELGENHILDPIKKGNKIFYDEDDIRIVELWAKARVVGFTKNLGFDTSIVNIFREMIERLVAEEVRIVIPRITGKISPDKAVKMIEDALVLANTFMELLHRKMIMKFVRKYAQQFQKSAVTKK